MSPISELRSPVEQVHRSRKRQPQNTNKNNSDHGDSQGNSHLQKVSSSNSNNNNNNNNNRASSKSDDEESNSSKNNSKDDHNDSSDDGDSDDNNSDDDSGGNDGGNNGGNGGGNGASNGGTGITSPSPSSHSSQPSLPPPNNTGSPNVSDPTHINVQPLPSAGRSLIPSESSTPTSSASKTKLPSSSGAESVWGSSTAYDSLPTSSIEGSGSKDTDDFPLPAASLIHRRLSAGAIAGIVIAIILLLLAFLLFCLRRQIIRHRLKLRRSWRRQPFVHAQAPISHMYPAAPAFPAPRPVKPRKSSFYFRSDGRDASSGFTSFAPSMRELPILPSVAHNSITHTSMSRSHMSHATSMVNSTETESDAYAISFRTNTITAKEPFAPTRSDEIHVNFGEALTVLGRYDDGWALCLNERGQQGMVPLTCIGNGAEIEIEVKAPEFGGSRRGSGRRVY